jgi:hypothetical protein
MAPDLTGLIGELWYDSLTTFLKDGQDARFPLPRQPLA